MTGTIKVNSLFDAAKKNGSTSAPVSVIRVNGLHVRDDRVAKL